MWLSLLCSKWQHFEKKRAKNRFPAGKLGHFWKTATNHLTSTKCCDQTTSATGITVERQYPYLSFGTWFCEIYLEVLLWWLLEKSGLIWAFQISRIFFQFSPRFFQPLGKYFNLNYFDIKIFQPVPHFSAMMK